MAPRQNNDGNESHVYRSSKKQRLQQLVGRLIVFSGLLLSGVGLWIYLFSQRSGLLELGLAIIGIGVLVTASARFWDWWERGSD